MLHASSHFYHIRSLRERGHCYLTVSVCRCYLTVSVCRCCLLVSVCRCYLPSAITAAARARAAPFF
ncbi:hypothetical protein [Methanimicrococcus hacksteinii]|uniref:hypothetical protein n=1 Tax=Methanimicrococcus hacksteinii TaxID=3028293 RepID=UPI00298F3607|nr:hypothetical protein [Methanimicrococcus sp. At1]